MLVYSIFCQNTNDSRQGAKRPLLSVSPEKYHTTSASEPSLQKIYVYRANFNAAEIPQFFLPGYAWFQVQKKL